VNVIKKSLASLTKKNPGFLFLNHAYIRSLNTYISAQGIRLQPIMFRLTCYHLKRKKPIEAPMEPRPKYGMGQS
jgi:hypothetical protein